MDRELSSAIDAALGSLHFTDAERGLLRFAQGTLDDRERAARGVFMLLESGGDEARAAIRQTLPAYFDAYELFCERGVAGVLARGTERAGRDGSAP